MTQDTSTYYLVVILLISPVHINYYVGLYLPANFLSPGLIGA